MTRRYSTRAHYTPVFLLATPFLTCGTSCYQILQKRGWNCYVVAYVFDWFLHQFKRISPFSGKLLAFLLSRVSVKLLFCQFISGFRPSCWIQGTLGSWLVYGYTSDVTMAYLPNIVTHVQVVGTFFLSNFDSRVAMVIIYTRTSVRSQLCIKP